MTFAWHRTSQKKSQTRLPRGERLKFGSCLDLRMRSRIGPKRRKKRVAEARIRSNRRSFSHVAKLCGSASVAKRRLIYEPTHDTRSRAGSARAERAGDSTEWEGEGGGSFWCA